MPIKGLSLFCGRWGPPAFLAALLCALLLLPLFVAHAQEKVLGVAQLDNGMKSLPLGKYVLIQQDPDEAVTVKSIIDSGGAILTGKQGKSDSIHLGYGGVPVWLTLKLQGRALNDEWIIDLGRRAEGRMGHLKSIRIYEMTLTSPLTVNEIMPERAEDIYKITVPSGQEKFVLFSITPSAGKPSVLPLKIFSEASYVDALKENAFLDMVYGIGLGALAAFFLALATFSRKPSFAIFGIYFLYSFAFWITYNNMSMHSGPGIFSEMMLVFALGYSILAIFMTKFFWGIEYGSYTEKYILYGLIWLNIVASVLSLLLPVGDGIAHIALYYGAPVITISIICLMSLAQARSVLLKDNLFLISWILPLFGLVITVAAACQMLPPDPVFLNCFWYSILIQGAVLGCALHRKLQTMGSYERSNTNDSLSLHRMKETKESADNSRLLKVIQKEREMLAEFRTKEAIRTEEMRVAKEAADEANRAKSAFLAVVSHEIRTPMSGVMGMVKLLLDSNISKQQRDYALTIKESGEAMLGLLNDILDFEKIQRGKIELENISFDLHRLIQGMVTLMSGHAADKKINLVARMDENIPRFVKGDPTRLRQVLLNLMGNAIKFTETGTVTMFIKSMNQPESDDDDEPTRFQRHMIYFAVQDSGIGISADAQKNLFNPFSQANSSVARKFGGSGLGLAISKGLVEIMGSSININSKEGEGSTFFFTLEMEKGLSSAQEKARGGTTFSEDEIVHPLKILIVDDNNITRKVMVGFLEKGRHDIVMCGTSEEALKKINQDAFDLIFMDIELPGMKGNEAVKILRQHPDPVKRALPVIAMTGNIAKDDIDGYLDDGMTGALPKPIDADRLYGIIRDVARNTHRREVIIPGHEMFPDVSADKEFDSFAPPPPQEERPVIDQGIFNPDMLQSLKDAIGAKQMEELLTDLITKTEEILVQMDEATKLGDLQSLAARAHELKGMAGNFGLTEISTIAAQTERKAKTNEVDGLGSLVDTLPEASARAQTALKDWAAH